MLLISERSIVNIAQYIYSEADVCQKRADLCTKKRHRYPRPGSVMMVCEYVAEIESTVVEASTSQSSSRKWSSPKGSGRLRSRISNLLMLVTSDTQVGLTVLTEGGTEGRAVIIDCVSSSVCCSLILPIPPISSGSGSCVNVIWTESTCILGATSRLGFKE